MFQIKVLTCIVVSLFFFHEIQAQEVQPGNLAHTYSIVARDSVTGELGVAVQTHWFGVGVRVPWAEANVGAVATQSFTNPSFGPRGLALLKEGKTPEEALKILVEADEGRNFRQAAIIDNQGRAAAWTGKSCIKDAGHQTGPNFSVQANLMLNDRVWPEMAEAFESTEGELVDRLIAALEAGQNAGGDIRGMQSAALIVVKGESTGKPWNDRLFDLRVDDNANPISELRRLVRIRRAYLHAQAGDDAIENDDVEKALDEYQQASELYPENVELKFWQAVSLANSGRLDAALPLFQEAFDADENWRTLTQRLPANDLLKVDESSLNKILELP